MTHLIQDERRTGHWPTPGAGVYTWRQSNNGETGVSTIDIHAFHALTREAAHKAAEELSQDLSRKFGIDYRWEGDHIHFQRPGVHGQILVSSRELHIRAYLGFMLMMLKTPIEQEVVRYLEEHFGCRFDA